MTGEALCWYQWMYENEQLINWESFSQALLSRFGPSKYQNPSAALFKLKQRGTVTEYQQEYEILANQVKGVSDEHLLHCFISRLHPEIQHEVIPLTPTNLTHALSLAKMIEAKLTAQRAIRRAHPGQVYGGKSKPMQNTSSAYKAPGLPAPPRLPDLPAPQIKRLTPTEMQARRAKGLCYNCDKKYVPGHKCRTVPFLLLQAEDEDEPGELFAIQADNPPELPPLSSLPLPPPPQNYTTPDSEDFQISYYALHGHSPHRCLKLKAKIAGRWFTVLVDSGSTHNLIQSRVAQFLNLPVQPALPLTIEVGNGETLKCSGRITDLAVDLQQHSFTLDLFLFDIHGAELVLGIQWLSQLGPIVMDFSG
ncbi:Retrotransposon gag protein [Corchorus olitorius]|uniref:Retrotransposon gag protein n=1 Tax=Corchorus olitorius TaxID=93759 RepID=A0A1R3I6K5_9ROSI|nr:Retrotransposon gag protein [Corchorus olitorius]